MDVNNYFLLTSNRYAVHIGLQFFYQYNLCFFITIYCENGASYFLTITKLIGVIHQGFLSGLRESSGGGSGSATRLHPGIAAGNPVHNALSPI